MISVFGLGAVGLPLSLILSMKGLKVYGVDINKKRIEDIKNGNSGLFEYYNDKSIDEIIVDEISKGNFIPTTNYKEAVLNSEVIMITIPLPLKRNKEINYDFLIKGIENIGKNLKKDTLIILRSTVPIGTTRKLVLPMLEGYTGFKIDKDFYLSYVPERMAEGKAFEELVNMTTLIGGIGEKSIEKTLNFFKTNFNGDYHIVSKVEVAEASKIIENLQRDLNIAMVNSLANIFLNIGLIPHEVIEAAKTHKRVKNLLSPGLGVGGHCLPYAYYYLKESVMINKIDLSLFELGRKINDDMPKRVLKIILERLKKKGKDPKSAKLALLGLAMKDYSKDTRESPSLKFLNISKKYFKEVCVFDNEVSIHLEERKEDLFSTLKDSDVIVISIIQKSYENLKVEDIKNLVKKDALIVDIKGLLNKKELKENFDSIIF
ncbi:MAG: nucleotide sugar dehydrogenase [Caldisericia bacterium]|nr:nucleotide sugar dehydrogenase [Caldisericia bacterium]